MKRIFVKSFFDLSGSDQAAVVHSIIDNLKSCIGRHVNPEDDKKAEQRIKRILARAVQHGVGRRATDLPRLRRPSRTGPRQRLRRGAVFRLRRATGVMRMQ
jgi:hypothetical protein